MKPIFNRTLCTFIFILGMESAAAYADPTPVPAVDSTTGTSLTATDLPTKTKIPTDQTLDPKRKETDHLIEARLNRIAKSQDLFKNLSVSVVEGIVTLKGSVEEQSSAKSFSALSERVDGVIGVIDTLKVTDEKKTGLRLAQSEVDGITHKFFKFIPYLASCIVILLITLAIGLGTTRFWRFVLSKRMTARPLLVPHLSKLFSLPVYLFGAYLILQVGGAAGLAATLVGGTGVLGIILGLAGKNILENLLSSFMLTLRNPFKIGDEVTIGDQSGVIYRIDSRCTMLLTFDGIFTQIPNSTVLAAVIKNISAHPVNRVTIVLDITEQLGFTNFKKFFDNTLKLNEKTLLVDPKPKVSIVSLAGQHARVKCTFWVDTRIADPDEVKSNVLHALLHFMTQDHQSLQDVKDSIKTSTEEPTQKQVLENRTADIRAPSP